MSYRKNRNWDPDYRREPKTDLYCAHCQKDLDPKQAYRRVHVVDGGANLIHPDDEALWSVDPHHSDEQRMYPVGPECAKRLGLAWTHPPISEATLVADVIAQRARKS
jgi:hypothetical protein